MTCICHRVNFGDQSRYFVEIWDRLAYQGHTCLFPMNFLEKTFRDWKVTLDPIAAKKPGQLKVASEAEAATTPPTMGTRDSSTGMLGVSPRKRLESRTEKKGSMDCKSSKLTKILLTALLAHCRCSNLSPSFANALSIGAR